MQLEAPLPSPLHAPARGGRHLKARRAAFRLSVCQSTLCRIHCHPPVHSARLEQCDSVPPLRVPCFNASPLPPSRIVLPPSSRSPAPLPSAPFHCPMTPCATDPFSSLPPPARRRDSSPSKTALPPAFSRKPGRHAQAARTQPTPRASLPCHSDPTNHPTKPFSDDSPRRQRCVPIPATPRPPVPPPSLHELHPEEALEFVRPVRSIHSFRPLKHGYSRVAPTVTLA